MINQLDSKAVPPRFVRFDTSAVLISVLSACANYAGIHSDHQMAPPQAYETSQSRVSASGNWPAPDWADQFGDPQLHALLAEALKGNPSLDKQSYLHGTTSSSLNLFIFGPGKVLERRRGWI
jgi:hypothetical protein